MNLTEKDRRGLARRHRPRRKLPHSPLVGPYNAQRCANGPLLLPRGTTPSGGPSEATATQAIVVNRGPFGVPSEATATQATCSRTKALSGFPSEATATQATCSRTKALWGSPVRPQRRRRLARDHRHPAPLTAAHDRQGNPNGVAGADPRGTGGNDRVVRTAAAANGEATTEATSMAPTPTTTFIRNLNTARSVLLDCFSESSLITASVDVFESTLALYAVTSPLYAINPTLRAGQYLFLRVILLLPDTFHQSAPVSEVCCGPDKASWCPSRASLRRRPSPARAHPGHYARSSDIHWRRQPRFQSDDPCNERHGPTDQLPVSPSSTRLERPHSRQTVVIIAKHIT